MSYPTVTGVGARDTPPAVLKQMRDIGAWCRATSVRLRSGHADGADWAFEQGAQEFCTVYLPWRSFNLHLESLAERVLYRETEDSRELVGMVHGAPDKLNRATWALHGRNTWQVLGRNLDRPSSVLVCWTPGGFVCGGTATTITLAKLYEVPVVNLATGTPADVFRILDAWRG